jgi:hypothetical protein
MSEFKREAAAQEASRKLWLEWNRQRVEDIHQRVTAHDILRHGGVSLRGNGEEQISCPFHGADNRPSARIYPEDARNRSHVWCFVCQERWDAIALWKKFYPGEKTFSRVLTEIEQAFGLKAPEQPTEVSFEKNRVDLSRESFDALYQAAEGRLVRARAAYQYLDDLTGYLSAGQVLDKLRYRVDSGRMPPQKGEQILRELLARIAKKVRSCPVG